MSRRALRWTLVALGLLAAPAFAADTVYYYSSDTLHSAVVVTDQNRNVVERTTHYAPYGQVLNRDLRDGPGYTGHEEDPETGLVYMQQRYYDPEAGRFLSTDPVQVDGGGGSFNRYEYANDNPYRYTDPDGRCTGSHLADSRGNCLSTGTTTTQITSASVTAVRAWNTGRIAYVQYADGAVERRTGSRAWRDNNPGNLRQSGPNSRINGSIGSDTSPSSSKDRITAKLPYAMFGSTNKGEAALSSWLSRHGTQTISQAISAYAPAGDANDTSRYASFIHAYTGASDTATLKSLTSSQRAGVIRAIEVEEGFSLGGNATIIYNGGPGPFSQ